VTANTVKKLLIEGNRRWFGLDVLLVSGPMAQALKVPQEGGFLVKQVAKDSIPARLGMRGGDRIGIVEGQQIVVGGDIMLSVLGIPMMSNEDIPAVRKAIETLKPGEDLRAAVLRDEQVVELSMKWTGF